MAFVRQANLAIPAVDSQNGFSYSKVMAARVQPNRISELRLSRRWSQQELAEKVPAHSVTISKLERGDMKLTQGWMEKIAAALQVQPQELLSDSPLIRTIFVDGWIEKSGDVTADRSATDVTAVAFTIELGTPPPGGSLWYFATARLFAPGIHIGDVVRFTYYPNMDPAEHFNRICMLELNDRLPLVGILRRGVNASYDLTLPSGEINEGLRSDRISVLTMVVATPKFPQGFEF